MPGTALPEKCAGCKIPGLVARIEITEKKVFLAEERMLLAATLPQALVYEAQMIAGEQEWNELRVEHGVAIDERGGVCTDCTV